MVLQEFPEIVARYKSRFYAMAWRFTGNAQDAEDLCQEIFLQVFRNLASFRGQSQLSTWLYRVALNRCLSYRRNAGRRPPVAPDATALSFMTDPGPTPEELALRQDRQASVQQVLQCLGPRYQQVIELIYFQQCTQTEAAAILGIAPRTVETRLRRARQKLKPLLEKQGYGKEADDIGCPQTMGS